ncbi:hypothetical protein K439DRAFT_1618232 [Ramaria rubella]|nr:hypothetical protein K439DRAFT_1618232 [Ramaria rubella]
MTKWITWQEKIHAFAAYLQWCTPKAQELDEGDGEEDPIDMVGEPPMYSHLLPTEEHDEEINIGHTYHVAKHPGYPNTSVPTIVNHFGAVHFLPALMAFLNHANPAVVHVLNKYTCFDLYKQVRCSLRSIQQIDQTTLTDVVCATPLVPHQGHIAKVPVHFKMVLVCYTADAKETGAQGQLSFSPSQQ